MAKSKAGDTVRVHYTGLLDDGTVFDSSRGGDPLTFVLGDGKVIRGFDAAATDLEVGEVVTAVMEPNDAYGPRIDGLVHRVPVSAFEEGEVPIVGGRVDLVSPEGDELRGEITEVLADEVEIDFNHALAGKQLTFEIELVEIV